MIVLSGHSNVGMGLGCVPHTFTPKTCGAVRHSARKLENDFDVIRVVSHALSPLG